MGKNNDAWKEIEPQVFYTRCGKGTKKVSPHWKTNEETPNKTAATYSPTLRCSTIGACGLNFSVRDGKRWSPAAVAT